MRSDYLIRVGAASGERRRRRRSCQTRAQWQPHYRVRCLGRYARDTAAPQWGRTAARRLERRPDYGADVVGGCDGITLGIARRTSTASVARSCQAQTSQGSRAKTDPATLAHVRTSTTPRSKNTSDSGNNTYCQKSVIGAVARFGVRPSRYLRLPGSENAPAAAQTTADRRSTITASWSTGRSESALPDRR